MGVDKVLIVGPSGVGASYHDKVYEDTFEALVAAVYCDLGFDAVKSFVKDIILRHVDPEYLLIEDNYKEVLRRYTVKHRMYAANYQSNTCGNETECTCTVYTHEGPVRATAREHTKRKAEMEASKNVLLHLGYDIYAESIL
jgi:dsRNA-specific ribonuclease